MHKDVVQCDDVGMFNALEDYDLQKKAFSQLLTERLHDDPFHRHLCAVHMVPH
ncbi:hypothetical protein MA16_Dca028683 [Dendrobium catenatum]|uniref:Uncharacterized protein n=1 Tax=Dendrobium catenatum TaxID=906689 RepID=A0A2I0V9F5_9ASPA|nr:hypothetical protein MA16_Dca028683 [Dendrobium catenatum]